MSEKDNNLERYILSKKYKTWHITDKTFLEVPQIQKYHPLHVKLNSNINSGLIFDIESWYSFSPESVLEKVCKELKRLQILSLIDEDTILCAYCGSGGDSLTFLKNRFNIIANDLFYRKLKFLKHNVEIYRSKYKSIGKIQYLLKDFYNIEKTEFYKKPFCAFLSPPWGGVDYKKNGVFDLEGIGFSKIVEKTRELADNMILFMPRTCDHNQIRDIVGDCHIRRADNGKIAVGILIYIGPLFTFM